MGIRVDEESNQPSVICAVVFHPIRDEKARLLFISLELTLANSMRGQQKNDMLCKITVFYNNGMMMDQRLDKLQIVSVPCTNIGCFPFDSPSTSQKNSLKLNRSCMLQFAL